MIVMSNIPIERVGGRRDLKSSAGYGLGLGTGNFRGQARRAIERNLLLAL